MLQKCNIIERKRDQIKTRNRIVVKKTEQSWGSHKKLAE